MKRFLYTILLAVFFITSSQGQNLFYPEQIITDPNFVGTFTRFGGQIKIQGNTMVISAVQDESDPEYSGTVYVYRNNNGNWELLQQLRPSVSCGNNCSEFIGYNIDLSDNAGIITVTGSGGLFIYTKNSGGGWNQTEDQFIPVEAQSTAISPLLTFNSEVLNGYRIALGNGSFNGQRGKVEVYAYSKDNNEWVLEQEFAGGTPNDRLGEKTAWFGRDLLMSATGHQNNTGRVNVFRATERINPARVFYTDFSQIIRPSDGVSGDFFGINIVPLQHSVAISSQANGGQGAVYIYDDNGVNVAPGIPNFTENEQVKLIPIANTINFGRGMTSFAGHLAISAFTTEIYLYNHDVNLGPTADGFVLNQIIRPPNDGLSYDIFGNDGIASYQDRIVTFARRNDTFESFVYDLDEALPVSQQERSALSRFYGDTKGANWINNTNWRSSRPVREWFGIETQVFNGQEHISNITLIDNNLTPKVSNTTFQGLTELRKLQILNGASNSFAPGEGLPANLGTQLSNLEVLNIRNWNIGGNLNVGLEKMKNLNLLRISGSAASGVIPETIATLDQLTFIDISSNGLSGNLSFLDNLNLQFLRIDNNRFQFGDLESSFEGFSQIPTFIYNPQENLQNQNIDAGGAEEVTLTVEVSGQNNRYKWYYDNKIIDGATGKSLTIGPKSATYSGQYSCDATNDKVPNLIITTTIEVTNLEEPKVPKAERDALIALYNATGGESWTNRTNWNTDAPVREWYGIAVENGHVTEIDLNNNNLRPVLPPEIGNLTELRLLEIWNDYRNFGSNDSGIPAEIENCKKLEYIDIRSWGLAGSLPDELADLPELYWIDLRQNSFTGAIPEGIAMMPRLVVFVISDNLFEEKLPDFTQATELAFLWIDNNLFQFGDFEEEFTAYKSKTGLNFIFQNQKQYGTPMVRAVPVGGSVELTQPEVRGTDVTYSWWRSSDNGNGETYVGEGRTLILNIEDTEDYGRYRTFATSPIVNDLTLYSAGITVGAPPQNQQDYNALVALYNATNGDNWTVNTNWLNNDAPLSEWYGISLDGNNRVTNLDLSGNNLTGSLPTQIGDLTELTSIDLFLNSLSGDLPQEFWNLLELERAIMGAQEGIDEKEAPKMMASIPEKIKDMTKLNWLNLSGYRFTENLPEEMFTLPNLEFLRLNHCDLTEMPPIWNLPKIKNVFLFDNALSGELNKEFGSIGSLETLYVFNNNLEGPLPDFSQTILKRLSVSNNIYRIPDLEEFLNLHSIQTFAYSPQRTLDEPETIKVAPGGEATFAINESDLTSNAGRNSDNSTYKWFKDNVAITGAEQSTYTINNLSGEDSGTYYAEITNSRLPGLIYRRADIVLVVDETLGTITQDDRKLMIYPNPVSDVFTVKGLENKTVAFTLYDISGKQVKQFSMKGAHQAPIDVSHLAQGVYFLTIATKQATERIKFIKN
ncbi:MAG: T9SS type A sorting domain-containing protein [Leeuwenhoekiella sp.]